MDEKQKASIQKYLSGMYDIRFRIPKEREAELKYIASDVFGMSVQQFFLTAADELIATRMQGVPKFSGLKSSKERDDMEKLFFDNVKKALGELWCKFIEYAWEEDMEGNDKALNALRFSFFMSHSLGELLYRDENLKRNEELIAALYKPSKLMYYSIFDSYENRILCILSAAYVTKSDVQKIDDSPKSNTQPFNWLVAYQKNLIAMSNKYKNNAERKKIESMLPLVGIPYSSCIFPMTADGNESIDSEQMVLPTDFLTSVWNSYFNSHKSKAT